VESHQPVTFPSCGSIKAPVTSGVPQGTVLGPVLFLVYINDLSEYMKSSQLRLFADDSIIYNTIKSQKDCDSLQEDLDAATRWESDWLMTFHPDKCSVLTVGGFKVSFQESKTFICIGYYVVSMSCPF
jgi:sarcosine oxidase/L-pipecolate oxidase